VVVIAVGTLDDPANPRVNAVRQVRNHSPPQPLHSRSDSISEP
jgi:hypothetical protein